MDNRIISIQSEGRKAFDLAFQLLFDNAPGGKATHYLVHPEHGFILLWNEESISTKFNHIENIKITSVKLPYAMSWQQASEFVWGWLQNEPTSNYREYCDHDGSNGKGFKVYNEAWGHVAGLHYAFLAVLPTWAWYGK